MHARKTRERKKHQMASLQQRLDGIRDQGVRLRQLIDERHTANILIGLSGKPGLVKPQPGADEPYAKICSPCFPFPYNERPELSTPLARFIITGEEDASKPENRPPRRKEKLSREEREKIRRERNRVHAKRTRDRKKLVLEESSKIIACMMEENTKMRAYLTDACAVSLPAALQSDAPFAQDATDDDDADDAPLPGPRSIVGPLDRGADRGVAPQPLRFTPAAATAAAAAAATAAAAAGVLPRCVWNPAAQPHAFVPFAHAGASGGNGGVSILGKRVRAEEDALSCDSGHTSDAASSESSSTSGAGGSEARGKTVL